MNCSEEQLKQARQLYAYLQGDKGDSEIIQDTPPKLTKEEAFSVIYFMQEELRIIPDCIEICEDCGYMFDSENEGVYVPCKGHYCDNCGWQFTDAELENEDCYEEAEP